MEKTEIMMVKLDMKMAYDEVNKGFLLKVLEKFCFCKEWVAWVQSCINTPHFFVLVNGSPQGFFDSNKGIRQGDPISPFLFIILVEVLGRLISKKQSNGHWKGIKIVEGIDPISYLQFVDDTFLMGEVDFREARVMKETLDAYGKSSRQCINWRKS